MGVKGNEDATTVRVKGKEAVTTKRVNGKEDATAVGKCGGSGNGYGVTEHGV